MDAARRLRSPVEDPQAAHEVVARDHRRAGGVRQVIRSRGTHLHSSEPLRQRLQDELGDVTFEDLAVPFQCVAASVEKS